MSLECACVHYNNGRCKKFTDDKHTSWCNAEGFCKYMEPSNADRIRAMSDEELAEWFADFWDYNDCSEHERLSDCPLLREEPCDQKCKEHCLEWLKQPAEPPKEE